MDKKRSIEIADQLVKYFNAEIIGSQLFVNAGLLSSEDTRDIDIAIDHPNTPMTVFLEDLGFTSKEVTTGEPYQQSLARLEYSHPEYDKVIDLNIMKKPIVVYSIPELVMDKFKSGRPDDLKQLSLIVFNAGGNSLKSYRDLQQFYRDNQPEDNGE